MALVVEDGTGLSTADAYISIADANTYIAAYKSDVTAWDLASVADKEVAARQATLWLDGKFVWRGTRSSEAQALLWPRYAAYDDDGYLLDAVPEKLVQATAEVMYLIINGETITETVSRGTQVISEKVGDIEVEYSPGAGQQPVFPEVMRLLSALIFPGGRAVLG